MRPFLAKPLFGRAANTFVEVGRTQVCPSWGRGGSTRRACSTSITILQRFCSRGVKKLTYDFDNFGGG